MPLPAGQRRQFKTAVATFAWLLIACLSVGCNRQQVPAKATPEGKVTEADNQETESEKCRKKLAAAIRRMDPEQLALQANPERAINGLNAWISSCAADSMQAMEVSEAALTLLDSNPRVTAGRFTANDAAYIRDCIVLRDLGNAIWERTERETDGVGTDAARVNALFDWIVRNVSLMPADEERVPVGLFDVLLTGRGVADDRTWIFVAALRQQHVHSAFLIQTEATVSEGNSLLDSASSLIAVVLEDGSLVFDPQAGHIVQSTANGDTEGTSGPANLQTVQQHDRWKKSHVRLVAQHSAFAPRMLTLQNELAAEDSAVFYEELTGGVSELTPLIDLVVTAGNGHWTADDVAVWAYPEQRTVEASSLAESDKQNYSLLMRPFDAPFERKIMQAKSAEELTTVPEELPREERNRLAQERLMENFIRMNQSSEEMFGEPSRRLLKARIRQMLGNSDTGVIQQLQQIRISSMQEAIRVAVPDEVQKEFGMPPILEIQFPQLIREVNQSSTGDSLYWTAMCQMDRSEVGAAITTLMNYRRQYPKGKWFFPSMINQAVALLAQDRNDDAKLLLQEADKDDNPERQRVQVMLNSLAAP